MGNSAIVGMETKNASKSSGAWFGITGQSKSRVALYADIYIDTIGSYSFFLRGSTGSIYSTDIQFKKDGTLNFAGSGDNSLKSIPYEAKKWYSIEYYVDTVKKTYSFVMDGVPLALNYNISNQNMDTVNAIRFVGPNYDSIKTFGAIDNLRTVRFEPLPCVTGIAGESTMADSDNTYVDLSFSDSVDVSSIGVDDVEFSLPDEIDSILAVDGTTIRINLKNMLLSNNEYFIKINSGLKAVSIGSTVSLTAPQSVKFNTKPNDVEMTNERVEGTAFNCTLKNNTSAEKTVYLIESVFSANRIENVLCLPIVIGGNEESPVSYIAGQNSRIVILDGVTNAKAISEKTFVVK